jgi:hypothetical protein
VKEYRWLLKHWKQKNFWTKAYVRKQLATKLRKKRSYDKKEIKVVAPPRHATSHALSRAV